MFVFSHIFPLLCELTFSMFWELYGFLLRAKYLRNSKFWNVSVFPSFSLTMGIHFSHVLGVVWISTSGNRCKKPITLCFSLLFFYHGIPLSTCFGNSIHFRLTLNILRSLIMCNGLWLPIFFL